MSKSSEFHIWVIFFCVSRREKTQTLCVCVCQNPLIGLEHLALATTHMPHCALSELWPFHKVPHTHIYLELFIYVRNCVIHTHTQQCLSCTWTRCFTVTAVIVPNVFHIVQWTARARAIVNEFFTEREVVAHIHSRRRRRRRRWIALRIRVCEYFVCVCDWRAISVLLSTRRENFACHTNTNKFFACLCVACIVLANATHCVAFSLYNQYGRWWLSRSVPMHRWFVHTNRYTHKQWRSCLCQTHRHYLLLLQ